MNDSTPRANETKSRPAYYHSPAPYLSAGTLTSAADEVNNFDSIAFAQNRCGPFIAPNNHVVQLDRYSLWLQT